MEKKQTAVEWLIQNLDTDKQTQSQIFQTMNDAFKKELAQLYRAFKAGWMKANAITWNDQYFETYLKSITDDTDEPTV